MSAKKDNKEVGTTGHSWDGIEEYDNPLPRWWLWIFYATIVWGIWYTIAYPAWPLLTGATEGYKGFSTRGQVEQQIADVDAANADMIARLENVDLTLLAGQSDLNGFAVNAGAAVFKANCSQCHGSGAAGAKGYPNLLDNDWLWGGTIDEVAMTITDGVRNEQSPDARGYGFNMPAFADMISNAELDNVVQYVLSLSNSATDSSKVAAGLEVWDAQGCAGCHGDMGAGIEGLGAPVLNDAIWLYGGSEAALKETILNGRGGVMPAWSEAYRPAGGGLSQAEINAVAAYVHQLGGGL